MLDYSKEPVNDYFLIDMKSFYSSVECVERNLDPLTAELVVMSRADNTGSGLTLAASPTAKSKYGITNVSRPRDLPYPLPKELHIVPPRMNLYIKKNMEVNSIFRQYVADEDLLIYSIDESILKGTKSLNLFTTADTRSERRKQLARQIQSHVYCQTGLIATVGIGDNPVLAKLALDNEAKHNKGFVAEWTYKNVPEKIWTIKEMTDFWGIGSRMKKRLNHMGILSIKDLANWNPYSIKRQLGVIGLQLYFHANGIDRTDIALPPEPTKEKSYGNSQVLPKDYTKKEEVEIVVKEMAEQVAARIRQHKCKTGCVRLYIGTSILETKSGFSHQMKIPLTDNTKELQYYCLYLFNKYYEGQEVRHVGITYSKLVYTDSLQLDLFSDPQQQINEEKLDKIIDKIRQKYGFTSIVHASSKLEGARSITRSTLVGGHAGAMEGLIMIEYNDRGRLKWAGFYLSDHTEKIDADVEQRANLNLAKEQMTTEEITEVLNAAVLKRKVVCIQKEERDTEGYYPDDIKGEIHGYDELGIFIRDHKIHYDEIRHIEIQELDKWSQL